ncbi:MAG: YidC/Oxa1 family membrane protein insertase [Clostridia bacterium]|nr:YidC/Oxa1 family membrane protein insertase [Clostridia bacterium]
MFESILSWLHNLVGNYGIAVILFTLLVRIVLFPFDYKSRKSMRKTAKLQPKLAVLQKKYANDREKLNRKTQELYKQEGVSPLSGCLPMLLSYPILIIMFNAMRGYANQQTAQQVLEMLKLGSNLTQQNAPLESFLWIRNLYMADSPVVSRLVDLNTLNTFGSDIWTNVLSKNTSAITEILAQYPRETMLDLMHLENYGAVMGLGDTTQLMEHLKAMGDTAWMSASSSFTTTNLSNTLNLLAKALSSTELYKANTDTSISLFLLGTVKSLYNGFWILPIFSAVSQFIMTKLTPTQQTAPAANDQQAQSQQATGKFMKWFFPIFSLWICASSTAAFALYWVTSNLIMMAQTVLLNKYLDKKEQKDTIAGEGIVQ